MEDEPIQRLADTLESVNDNLNLIRRVLDEIREDLQWGVRNDKFRLVSMAADPTAEDFRLNRLDEPETIACVHCDAASPRTLAEALRQGWENLTPATDMADANWIGVCAACSENGNEVPDGEGDSQPNENVADQPHTDGQRQLFE